MFSLITTMFYMLTAYIAFLVGSSSELSLYLMALVPFGFVVGYLLDRLNSVKRIWVEDKGLILKTIVIRYFMFVLVSGAFCAAGLFYASR